MTSATSTDTAVAQYSTAYNGESETHDETYAAEYDNPTAAVEPLLDAETVLASLIHQLEFYFSPSNLATDSFLLSQMDQARFVPVDLICSFRRVTALTSDRAMVLEAMRRCRVVQLDDTETLVKPSANWNASLSYCATFRPLSTSTRSARFSTLATVPPSRCRFAAISTTRGS